MLMHSAHSALKNNVDVEEFSVWAYKFFQAPTKEYKEGLQDKVIDLKRVEMRLNAINSELGKLSSFEQTEDDEEVIKQEEQWEQPLQTENLEPAITVTSEELDDAEENQEDAQSILNIINEVA